MTYLKMYTNKYNVTVIIIKDREIILKILAFATILTKVDIN